MIADDYSSDFLLPLAGRVEPERLRIIALEIEGYSVTGAVLQCFKRRTFSDDRRIDTLRCVGVILTRNAELKYRFHTTVEPLPVRFIPSSNREDKKQLLVD